MRGWVGDGKVEEIEAVRMSYCELGCGVGGWVGGWEREEAYHTNLVFFLLLFLLRPKGGKEFQEGGGEGGG